MPDRARTVAFTGHRPQSLGGFAPNPIQAWIRRALAEAIDAALDRGVSQFISGMALGVDTWAAIEVLNRRDRGAHVIAAVPFVGQESLWPADARHLYTYILGEADLLHVVSPGGFTPQKMLTRDAWMVDHASGLIAVWDGRTRGGTYHTVRYARVRDIPLLQIDPRHQQVIDHTGRLLP